MANVKSIHFHYEYVWYWDVSIFKGILHQKIFYRLNLIFWIVMGCGIARFGRRGLKTTETWKFWSQNLSPGVLRRGAPGVSRRGAMGFQGAAQGFRGAAPWGFEARRHGVSRGGATDKRLQWFIIWRCPSRSHLITRDLEGQRQMINHWSVLSVALPVVSWRWIPTRPMTLLANRRAPMSSCPDLNITQGTTNRLSSSSFAFCVSRNVCKRLS